MNPYETKLKQYMKDNNINAEHLSFTQSCHSVKEAADAVGGSEGEFVKNICVVDSQGGIITAIVMGADKVSTKKVAKALEIERPTIASPDQILEKTGYPCGGTPSFGYDATFLIDPKVMEIEEVYSGGGSQQSLVKIKTQELLRANRGKVVRVRK